MLRKLRVLQIVHDLVINQNLLITEINHQDQITLERAHHRHVQVILDHLANHPRHRDQVTRVHRVDHHHLDLPTANHLQVLHLEVHLQKVVQEVAVHHEAVVEEGK